MLPWAVAAAPARRGRGDQGRSRSHGDGAYRLSARVLCALAVLGDKRTRRVRGLSEDTAGTPECALRLRVGGGGGGARLTPCPSGLSRCLSGWAARRCRVARGASCRDLRTAAAPSDCRRRHRAALPCPARRAAAHTPRSSVRPTPRPCSRRSTARMSTCAADSAAPPTGQRETDDFTATLGHPAQ
jgi:hypothetical protein